MDPRSVRTFNPGAMNFGPFAMSHGAVGSDGRLAIFPDMTTGFKAMSALLDNYANKGRNSVSSIINRWAPAGVDNNSTGNYIRSVAMKLGVDPNAPLTPEHRQPLMEAMASYEAGRPVTMEGNPQMGLMDGVGRFASPGLARTLMANQPPAQITTGSVPQDQPQQQPGFFDTLAARLNAPLTQQGLGLFLAASQGSDLNAGLNAGANRAALYQKQAQDAIEARKAAALDPLRKQLLEAQIGKLSAEIEQGRGGKTGLQPIYGLDADGNAVIMQATPTGELVRSRVPGGITPLGPSGTYEQREMGKARGEARAGLARSIQTAGEMLSQIRSLRDDPYLSRMTGALDGRLPNWSGAASRVQSKIDQIKGSTFLSAYERLKGGGQITEIEGAKAEAALARLQSTQGDSDFISAMDDLEQVINNGLVRARVQAGQLPESALTKLYKEPPLARSRPGGNWSIKRLP